MKTAKILLVVLALLSITHYADAQKASIKNPKQSPARIVKLALQSVPKNYIAEDNWMNAFYKEQVSKNDQTLVTHEAFLDVCRSSYASSRRDVVAVKDVRGSSNHDILKQYNIKLQGGPVSALDIDIVKYPFLGVALSEIDAVYTFKYEAPTQIDGQDMYVISFDQKERKEQMLYKGKIYIDPTSLAIARIEFSSNLDNVGYAHNKFLKKRPKNSFANMVSADYVVNYKKYNGLWTLDYSSYDIKFYIQDKDSNEANLYNISSQFAVTNLFANNIDIDKREILKNRDILGDRVVNYNIANNWDVYNAIMLLASVK